MPAGEEGRSSKVEAITAMLIGRSVTSVLQCQTTDSARTSQSGLLANLTIAKQH